MSRMSQRKGNRIEREIIDAHKKIGVHGERYPRSGATHFRGSGHDLDIYAFGKDEAPLIAEVKARGEGQGFALIERWLGEYDLLFLKRDRGEAMVVLPWATWKRLVGNAGGAITNADTVGHNDNDPIGAAI